MKEWIRRALRTFFQAAVGYAAVAIPAIDFDGDGLRAALIGLGVSAISAGLAAAMNINDEENKNG